MQRPLCKHSTRSQTLALHRRGRHAGRPSPSAVRANKATRKEFNASIDEAYADADLEVATGQRWSNLDPDELVHRPGSVFGAAVLVAGTTIGAGILALPEVTKDAGFVPSCGTLLAFYVFSLVTGLMITEVSLNTVCELGNGATSLQSMVKRTLGGPGAAVASAAYVFLHYSLLVAYIARAGGSVAEAAHLPMWMASGGFTVAVGAFCFFSSTRFLDTINTGLLALVILSFLGLVGYAAPAVNLQNLEAANWSGVIDTLPVVALAFVYQNIVPVITTSLEGDVKKIRTAVAIGLAIPLLMFIGWEAAILGCISPGQVSGDPVMGLKASNPAVGPLIESFSFLAIVTSFIGFILGLSDFLCDALPIQNSSARIPAYLLTLVPAYGLALAFPDIFFAALDTAGTYGVLVLFGVLPAAMIWSEREMCTTLTQIRIVPGGRVAVLGTGALAAGIIINEVVSTLSSFQ